MSRFSLILLILACVQGAIIWGLTSSEGAESEVVDAKKLIDVSVDRVTELTIEDRVDKKSVTLKREGETWTLGNANGFPVQDGKVTATVTKVPDEKDPSKTRVSKGNPAFLDRLLGIEVRSPVVRSASNHGPMSVGVDSYAKKVELKSSESSEPVTVFIGRGASSRSIYLRLDGEDEVYEAEDVNFWELSVAPATWTGRDLTKIDPEEFVSIMVTRKDQPPFLLKKDELWRFDNEGERTVNQGVANTLVTKLGSLAIEDVYGKSEPADAGFESPIVSFEVTLKSGTKETFVIGKKTKDGDYTCHWKQSSDPKSGYYVLLTPWSVEDAVNADSNALTALKETEDSNKK